MPYIGLHNRNPHSPEVFHGQIVVYLFPCNDNAGEDDVGFGKVDIFRTVGRLGRSGKHIDFLFLRFFEDLFPVLAMHNPELNTKLFLDNRNIIGGDTPITAVFIKILDGWKVGIGRYGNYPM